MGSLGPGRWWLSALKDQTPIIADYRPEIDFLAGWEPRCCQVQDDDTMSLGSGRDPSSRESAAHPMSRSHQNERAVAPQLYWERGCERWHDDESPSIRACEAQVLGN